MGDTVEVGHHFVVGEPHNLISFLGQIGVAPGIARASRLAVMRVAIDFHDQPRALADKVAEIGAEPLLKTEFVAVQTAIAEDGP